MKREVGGGLAPKHSLAKHFMGPAAGCPPCWCGAKCYGTPTKRPLRDEVCMRRSLSLFVPRLVAAASVVCVAGLGLTGCEDPEQFYAVAEFDPPILDLGPIATGAECEATLMLLNRGNRDMNVEGGSLENVDGDWVIGTIPEFVALGGEQPVTVNYTAGGTIGERQSTVVRLVTNAGSPDNGIIEGTITAIPTDGTAPVALTGCEDAIPCDGLDFGAVQKDDPTVPAEQRQGLTKTIQIINDGTAPLEVQFVAVQNGNPDFIVSGLRKGNLLVETPVTLEPGRTSDCGTPIETLDNVLTIDVFYSPTALGLDNDELTIITDSVENSTLTVPLSGTGSDIGILPIPSFVNFGSLGEGNTDTISVNVSNLGTTDAAVNTTCIDLGGDGTCDADCTGPIEGNALSCIVLKDDGSQDGKGFILDPTDASEGGGDERTIEITWSPVAGDAAIPEGTVLRLETNLLNNKVWEVPVVGGSIGVISIDSDDLCGDRVCVSAMGDVDDISTWAGTATITLLNTGDASLSITSFEWDGPETIADDYELQTTDGTAIDLGAPGITLAPNASEQFQIAYANDDASVADFINLVVNHTGVGGQTIIPLQVRPPQ